MRVFVSGASGYVGYAVAKAFRRHGHDVAGMVRNKGKARMLEAVEIKPVIGDLEKPDSYRDILDTCEVFVHCALEPSPRGQELDARTINTFFHQTKTLNLPRVFLYTPRACQIRSLSAQEAFDRFGPLAEGLKIDQTISNDRAFRLIDWKPRHPTFLEDLTRYYNAWHCYVEHKHHG